MGSKALKGLTIKIGGDTTELGKALEKVDKKSRSLSSELGHINRALKLDPTNTELLAQKQQVLAEAITNTETKLDTLKEAEKQVQAQFERGEVSQDQVRALRREIIETAAKLDKYKNAAKDAAGAGETLADSAGDAADQLRDQADSAKDADKANEALDDSSGDLASGGLAALTAAAIAAGAAFVATVEGSREYRNEMAKLNTAFQSSRYGGETAKRTYEELQSILGETDQAVEAAQQIALLADSEKAAAKWADLAAGLVGRLGNALQPETFYESANETLKLNEATGAYTQLLEQCGESVEKFNEGLAACSTEHEKQEYMLGVTERLLASASREYKNTNAEVIRANQATEKWNQATAKSGATLEPVLTDIKEMGAALWESADKPLEKIASFIRKDLLPAITAAGKWVKNNMPVIKAGIIGVTAAMVAFKAATIANTIAQKGLKGAIMATTIAQKALDLVQKSNPWGLVISLVAAAAVALVTYTIATKDAKKKTSVFTEEEKKLIEASKEAAEAFREQQAATEEALATITTEMGEVQKLADELETLVDKKGKVRDEDKKRVDFILGELNKALGTEYERTGDIIKNYKDLKNSIDEVIEAKTVNALLEAAQGDYTDALTLQTEAWSAKEAALEAYNTQLEATKKAEEEESAAWEKYNNQFFHVSYHEWKEAHDALETAQADLETTRSEYERAQAEYENYRVTIENYRTAQEAAVKGEYQTALDIFSRKGDLYVEHTETVDEETGKQLAILKKNADDAYITAKHTKEQFAKGIAGFGEEAVADAEQAYQEALSKWETAYNDAYGVGEDFGQGLADGITIKGPIVGAAASAQIRAAVNAAKKEADVNSPSKKTIEIGERMGEGPAVGIKKKTKDSAKAATNQARIIVDSFRAEEINAQQSLRNIADQQAARQTAGQLSAASANSGVLGQILKTLKDGQVLVLDGDAVVGGTAGKMDSRLGQLRILSARGAK